MESAFRQFFRRATDQEPFPYQVSFAVGDDLPDVLVAPTGAGKTATAVLGWLWRRQSPDPRIRRATPRRLVFCLPMRTLVDQTAGAARRWLDRLRLSQQVGLHVLMGGAVDHSWDAEPERDAILVGTQDQLLSRALQRGYAMSRYRWPVHFAFLNNDALWVLDEVQLMGPGLSTSTQLQAFRDRLGCALPARSVWMSATLDAGRLATVDRRDRVFERLTLSPADLDHPVLARRHRARKSLVAANTTFASKHDHIKAFAREILAAHLPDTRTIVVVNRVARAQALYTELGRLDGKHGRALVHSRFRPPDREATQARALGAEWTGILVATQAIEAGVDISARLLVTELAPWSSMVQRFGRCNRAGEHEQAEIRWIDVPDDEAAPYEPSDLREARDILGGLSDVGPGSLADVPMKETTPALPVIRGRDLLELFDTQPDLAGHDLDVSPFIRADNQRDVQVAWRDLPDGGPPADAPEPHRDELCSVPIGELRKLLTRQVVAYRWHGGSGRWMRVEVDRLAPGLVVIAPVAMGGYSAELGWTGDRSDRPAGLMRSAPPPDGDDREDLSFGCGDFVTLEMHADDVVAEVRALAALLSEWSEGAPWEAIARAARWHDLGKVHEVFQAMLTAGLAADDPRQGGGPWAKSDGSSRARVGRPHFRHELASALALLAQGGSDLEAYLVAAHHGKVRVSLRSRPGELEPGDGRRFALGVWDGDVLARASLGGGVVSAETRMDLDLMELGEGTSGPSWLARAHGLLETHGPFRLAYWEALVRVADWRGTARRRASSDREVAQ